MQKNTEMQLNTSSSTLHSSLSELRTTTILTDEELSDYAYCLLPNHYFDLLLAKTEDANANGDDTAVEGAFLRFERQTRKYRGESFRAN